MYGARNTQGSQVSHNGSGSPSSDRFEPIKDISDIRPSQRRLNDYTTIPRKPRTHGSKTHRNQPDSHGNRSDIHRQQSHVYRVKPEYIRQSTEGVHEPVKSSVEDIHKLSGSKGEHVGRVVEPKAKHKPWSFKKLRNALKRSKSLKSEKAESPHGSDESLHSGSSGSRVSDLLFTTIDPLKAGKPTVIDPVEAGWYAVKTVPKREDGIYDDIDNLRLGAAQSQKDISDCSSCRSGQSGSSMSMTVPGYKKGLDPEYKSSQKTGVLKALSSMTLRNIGTKKSSQKKPKPHPDQAEGEFRRDLYRGSFHDNSAVGKRLSGGDCRRCKSFTMPSTEKAPRDQPLQEPHRDSGIYSKQREIETRDGETLYSLARADDQPPPLPERTYLKMRTTALKENSETNDNPYKMPTGYTQQRDITFPLQEQNNNYKPASYPGTIPVRLQGNKPLHSMSPVQRRRHRHGSGHSTAKPFMLHHLRDGDQHTVSSGYSSSVASESLSTEQDYQRMPPPPPPSICTLPRRSKHLVSAQAPRLGAQSSTTSVCYSNKDSDQDEAVVRSETPRSDEEEQRYGLTSNVIHNLPLPPGPGGAQLIRTIQLYSILKNKWISGVAVTKKNEYIVVDQREAYLLDEEGSLKKSIGTKNSGRLIEPFNVCVSPSNGNLVICDHAEQDIKIYSWKGTFLKKVKDPGLTNIAGVAVTEGKDIVIAGTDKRRISILTEDGRLSHTIPSAAEASKPMCRLPFEHPYSVAVNPLTGDIIIGDDYKHMVTAVSLDQEDQPARVRWRYTPGPGDRHFFPSSICADSQGYIFIADLYNEKVYMLDSSGKFVKTLLSRGDGLRGGPGAIAADGRGHLLVADEEKTIKVFKYRDENGFAVNKRYSYCPQAS